MNIRGGIYYDGSFKVHAIQIYKTIAFSYVKRYISALLLKFIISEKNIFFCQNLRRSLTPLPKSVLQYL